jgi:hypothetical protein
MPVAAHPRVAPGVLYLGDVWDTCWKLLEKAIAHTDLDEEAVISRIHGGEWDLFVIVGHRAILGALTAELLRFPRGVVYRVLNAAAEEHTGFFTRDNVAALVGELAVFAVARGATRIEVIGRKGWARMLPDFYERERVFAKELA